MKSSKKKTKETKLSWSLNPQYPGVARAALMFELGKIVGEQIATLAESTGVSEVAGHLQFLYTGFGDVRMQ